MSQTVHPTLLSWLFFSTSANLKDGAKGYKATDISMKSACGLACIVKGVWFVRSYMIVGRDIQSLFSAFLLSSWKVDIGTVKYSYISNWILKSEIRSEVLNSVLNRGTGAGPRKVTLPYMNARCLSFYESHTCTGMKTTNENGQCVCTLRSSFTLHSSWYS